MQKSHNQIDLLLSITIYIAEFCNYLQLRKHQQDILDALDVRGIEYSVVDVSAPESEEDKAFMREHAQAKSGQSVPLPPQVFYDEEYLGVSRM